MKEPLGFFGKSRYRLPKRQKGLIGQTKPPYAPFIFRNCIKMLKIGLVGLLQPLHNRGRQFNIGQVKSLFKPRQHLVGFPVFLLCH